MGTKPATVMVIGGGQWQLGIIHRAKQLGLATVVTDRSAVAPARGIADVFVAVDATDLEAMLAVANRYRVDVVIAEGSDRHVPTAAYLNQQLGLNGIVPEVANRFTNKLAMRRGLRGTGVRMPRYAEVRSIREVGELAVDWGYPVVLKPKQSQASVGVHLAETPSDIEQSFPRTMAESTDGCILVEEFISGPEITVEALSIDGVCSVLAISEKEHYGHNRCVARRLAYPPRYSVDLLARISDTAQRVVESLGLRDGLSHAEYRIQDDQPYLVEVAARGGGNAIASTIVPHVSGVDVYRLLLTKLMGEAVVLPSRKQRAAVLEFLDLAPGPIAAVHGIQQVLADEAIADFRLYFEPGDTLDAPENDTARAGYFIALGETRDEVDARCARVREVLRVEYARA
jgi:biotin carboxylase